MTKKIKVLTICFIIIITKLTTICYGAWVPVTKENLEEAFNRLGLKEGCQVSIDDKVITVKKNDESYKIKYDLTDKPTFICEKLIEKGISYDEFEKKTSEIYRAGVAYAPVANIQGVDIEYAQDYISSSFMSGVLNNTEFNAIGEIRVVDDLHMSEGVTIEKEDNPNVFYTSEFGDRVIEYVNKVYKNKITISDADGINSYVYTLEKKDVTDTSCKLVSTLTVNLDADFSKINEEYENEGNNNRTEITAENADYVFDLKVGETTEIQNTESGGTIENHNSSCVKIEIERAKYKITAIKEGISYGYINIGEEKKSFYITVTDKENNSSNEIKDDTSKNNSTTNNDNTFKNNTTTNKGNTSNNVANKTEQKPKDNTTTSTTSIPKAGKNQIIVISILTCLALSIIIAIKLERYKNI